MKYCGQCGAELKDDGKFCANCGAKCPESDSKIRTVSTLAKGERKSQHSLMIGITAVLVIIAAGILAMCWYKSSKQQSIYVASSDNHIIASTDEKLTDAELLVGTWLQVDDNSSIIIFAEDGTVRIKDNNLEGLYSMTGSLRYELDGDMLIVISPEDISSTKYSLREDVLTLISDEGSVEFKRKE